MYEENIGDRDLNDGLGYGAAQTGENVGPDQRASRDVCRAVNLGLPDAAEELDQDAEDVQRSTTVFVDEGNKEDTSDGQAAVVDGSRRVEDVNGEAVLLDDGSPCCEADVKLDESPEDIVADEAVVDDLAFFGPVLGALSVCSRWSGLASLREGHLDRTTAVVGGLADLLPLPL
jgi:hypothetical protein